MGNGQWKPGQSGNPGGRAKGLERLVREATGNDLEAMIKMQIDIACGRVPAGIPIEKLQASDVTRAFNAIMDRGWGKPKQVVEVGPTEDPDENLPELTDEQLEALAALDKDLPAEAPPDDGDGDQ